MLRPSFAHQVSIMETMLAILSRSSGYDCTTGPASSLPPGGAGQPSLVTQGRGLVDPVSLEAARQTPKVGSGLETRPVPSTTSTGTHSSRPPAEVACPTSHLGNPSREVPA